MNPNSLILAAIWAICSSECARGFLANGIRDSSGRYSIFRLAGTAPVCSLAAPVEFFFPGPCFMLLPPPPLVYFDNIKKPTRARVTCCV